MAASRHVLDYPRFLGRLDDLQRRSPEYLPAPLAAAAIDLRNGRLVEARPDAGLDALVRLALRKAAK